MSILLYIFLTYLLYRLVFNFIIPIYKTTRQVKKGFRDMHERMQQHTSSTSTSQSSENGKTTQRVGEYIEFEEVK